MCVTLIFVKMKKRNDTFPSVFSDQVRSVNGKNVLKCVLFDWDGTLLDSFEADAQAYTHMFAALGMKWSIAELKRHYSPNGHHVYRAARLPRAKWEDADRLWMKFYRTHQPELQPGARRVLSALERRFILALVSSGSRARVRAVGVLGGSPVPERLRAASPDATIETIRELPGLLRNF